MEVQTIVHVSPPHKPLNRELKTRALRNALWLSLFHAQELRMRGLEHRLTVTLTEVDRLLDTLDAR